MTSSQSTTPIERVVTMVDAGATDKSFTEAVANYYVTHMADGTALAWDYCGGCGAGIGQHYAYRHPCKTIIPPITVPWMRQRIAEWSAGNSGPVPATSYRAPTQAAQDPNQGRVGSWSQRSQRPTQSPEPASTALPDVTKTDLDDVAADTADELMRSITKTPKVRRRR